MSTSSTFVYRGSTAEVMELQRLSANWSGKDFWTADDILLSLRIPRTFLIYAANLGPWQGLALGRMSASTAELFYIHVSPPARGQGLGRLLLQSFIEHASTEFAADEIFLEVRPSNRDAIGLYSKLGFVEQTRRKRYYNDGEDALVFTKDLRPSSPNPS